MANQDQHALAQRVEAAFQAARAGDFGPSSKLQDAGEAVVPLLKPFVTDANEAIRRQAVDLAGVLDGEAALPLLATALTDSSADIRQRAAGHLYEHQDPVRVAGHTELAQALQHYLTLESDAAAAVLLLSYFPDAATQAALQRVRANAAAALTKLRPWLPVVPLALPVDMALSRLGESEARRALLQRIADGRLEELQFLLEAIREIDAPAVLHALTATLADEREISSGVPSGAEPRRRLADLAVNAFVKHLRLQVNFELADEKRFSQAEIDQVKARINETLPR
jgi:hypothetical protein